MKRCLTEENLELLLRNRAPWWRAFFWRRHLRSCLHCLGRWEKLQDDDRLLADLRQAVALPMQPSPLTTAHSARGDRAVRSPE